MSFCWSWPGGWKRGGNRIRGHWFWNEGLRNLLHTSTRGSEKFQGEPTCFFVFFLWQKGIAFKYFWACTFTPWLLDSLDLLRYRSESNKISRLMPRVDYGFDQWSVVSFVIKKISVTYFWWNSWRYTNVLHANIFSPFMIWE